MANEKLKAMFSGGGLIAGLGAFSPLHFMKDNFASRKPSVDYYPDQQEPTKWRWRIKHGSDITAASSQGYATKALARENLLKLKEEIEYLDVNNAI
jgi:hypothetical protein